MANYLEVVSDGKTAKITTNLMAPQVGAGVLNIDKGNIQDIVVVNWEKQTGTYTQNEPVYVQIRLYEQMGSKKAFNLITEADHLADPYRAANFIGLIVSTVEGVVPATLEDLRSKLVAVWNT